ncbi:MAG: tetratricopeptide repeat protein [bacterium]|nr:tetratricopeptide repeat protein [bacterium]
MKPTRRVRIGVAVAVVLTAALLPLPAFSGPDTSKRSDSVEPLDPSESRGKAYALLMRSLFAARRGEFRAAMGEIRKAIELQPDSVQAHIQGAELLLWMGRSNEAEQLGNRALELAPEDAEAIRFMADMAAGRALGPRPDAKAREEALRLYEKLQALDAADDDVLRKLAGLRLQSGDRAGALAATRDLVENRPGDRRAVGMLAQLLLEAGDDVEALRVLLRFVTKHPNDEMIIGLAEEISIQRDAWSDVVEILGDGELGDRPVLAQRLLGEGLLRHGRTSEAVLALESAVEADPEDRGLLFSLARAYREGRRYADAAVVGRTLTIETPGDAGAHLLLAETLDDQGDVQSALNAFSSALRIFVAENRDETLQVRDAIRRRMAMLYLGNEQIDAATRVAAEFEVDGSVESSELLARVSIASEDWTEARHHARTLRTVGETAIAALVEGEVLARTGRWNKAELKFEELLADSRPEMRVRVAEIYLEADRPDLGLPWLDEWVAEAVDQPNPHYYLGSYLYRMDRFADAEVALRETFRLDPLHAPALNFLGYSLAERNERLDEALGYIERALAVDAWNGAYLDSLGWVYFRLGRFVDAREPLERAAREHPKDPTVLEHLGDLYFEIGEHELAVEAWDQAISAGVEDEQELRRKMARREGRSSGPQSEVDDESIEPMFDALSSPKEP